MINARKIIHVDMDAFYASVEQLDNPKLRGKAVIVGGASDKRAVVSAASYEARKFGVHSAMPMAQALSLCPHAVVMGVRMARYMEISRSIHNIFQIYTPQIEPISLDEAFLDVSASIHLFGSPESIGHEIKQQIKTELGLIASVGIASNKFLAKLASDLDKPDGFVIIDDNNIQQILDPLPAARIWGIGQVTDKLLHARGIRTIGQLRNTPVHILNSIFGNQAEHIFNLAHGIDDRPVESDVHTKSISTEQTFTEDIQDREYLLAVLLNQVEEVASRLRYKGMWARVITLKFRYGNFKTITRRITMDKSTDIFNILWQYAQDIFGNWYGQCARPLRLLGFGVSGLTVQGTGQGWLFTDQQEEKHQRLDQAFDAIRTRYGSNALKHGKLID